MRSVREILRLKAEGLSDRAIARSTRLARSTVSDYAGRAVAAGLSWPLPEGLTDTALEALLKAKAQNVVFAGITDRPATDACYAAGVGKTIPIRTRLRAGFGAS